MRRYRFMFDKDDPAAERREKWRVSSDHAYMRDVTDDDINPGSWVLYKAAMSAIDQAKKEVRDVFTTELAKEHAAGYNEGLNQDRADGPLKNDAMRALGSVMSQADATPRDAELEKRTEQLLNELYHDRAKLERHLKDACALIQRAMDMFYGETVYDAAGVKVVSKSHVLGWMGQFLDTHDPWNEAAQGDTGDAS